MNSQYNTNANKLFCEHQKKQKKTHAIIHIPHHNNMYWNEISLVHINHTFKINFIFSISELCYVMNE